MMTLKERLKRDPKIVALVEHFLEEHAPEVPEHRPVTLPRRVFDALAMVALVGLEALEED